MLTVLVVLYFLLVLGVCLYYMSLWYFLKRHKENCSSLAKTLALKLFCSILFVPSQRGRFGVKCLCSSRFSSSWSQCNEKTSEVHYSQNLLLKLRVLEEISKERLTLSEEASLLWFISRVLLIIGSFKARLSHTSIFSSVSCLDNSAAVFFFHLLLLDI